MNAEDVDTQVRLANNRYLDLKQQTARAQEQLFKAYAAAAKAGRTADELAQGTAFTAAYIRRKLREQGVEPRKGGPKPKHLSAQEEADGG